MARPPDFLTLSRHRDLVGRERRPWARRVLLSLLAVLLVAGLLNVFGQRPGTGRASGPVASLEVHAPTNVRGGLYYQARIRIRAHREIENATVVLDQGWLEGMTLNTVEPAPVGEASRNGRIALELGHIPAGAQYVLFLQLQVNPTNTGRRSQDVELDDGETPLLTVHRTVTVWP